MTCHFRLSCKDNTILSGPHHTNNASSAPLCSLACLECLGVFASCDGAGDGDGDGDAADGDGWCTWGSKGSLEFLQGLSRFVPSLIRIAPDAADAAALGSIASDDKIPMTLPLPTGQELQGQGQGQGRGGHGQGVSSNGLGLGLGLDEDRIGWREFKSLVSAAGLCRPSDSSSTSTRDASRIVDGISTG